MEQIFCKFNLKGGNKMEDRKVYVLVPNEDYEGESSYDGCFEILTEKPEKIEDFIEIIVKITDKPKNYSFLDGSGKELNIFQANTDTDTILNVVSVVKSYCDYSLCTVQDILKLADVKISSPDIEYIEF